MPALVFIGRIRTPWTSRLETPRQGRQDGPVCRLEIFEPWVPAIKGVDFYENLEVIYWLHQSRRDLVLQSPKNNQKTRGTFSLRSPVRPNPIATSIVKFVGIEGNVILVRGLDCLDETPLLDIKPDRCEFTPLAPPQPGILRRSSCHCEERSGRSNPARGIWIPSRFAPAMTESYPSAAISFVALSSSTFTSSLRLAGGSMRDAVVARQHVHVQMEHDLSAGGLVELLDGDAVGLEGLHRGGRDLVRGAGDMGVILGGDVEDVAGRGLRDHQRMAGRARHDVEEGQHVVVSHRPCSWGIRRAGSLRRGFAGRRRAWRRLLKSNCFAMFSRNA